MSRPVITLGEARDIALALASTQEADHWGNPSFRVGGRIFATVPDSEHMNVMIDPFDVESAVLEEPDACSGLRWGREGERRPGGSPTRLPGVARRPSGSSLAAEGAPTSSGGLPELSAAQEQVEDWADAPEEADDDPQHLRHSAHVLAVDDVDHAKDERDGVEEDRQQDLDDELDHAAPSVSRQRAAGSECAATRQRAHTSPRPPARTTAWFCRA